MLWNRPMFFSLFLLLLSVTVNSKYRGPPDAIKMITIQNFGTFAVIEFEAFEVNTQSFKIELHSVRDGKSITETVEKSPGAVMPPFIEFIDHLEPNGTYIVRVFAINEHGRSPPSPEIILSLADVDCTNWKTDCDSRPPAPEEQNVEYMLGNRVNVTWNVAQDRVWDVSVNKIPSPTEFIIRYGDNKNTSLWNTLKTNNTWILLDDLKKNTQYSAYVIAKKDNLTSLYNYIFPIFLGEDMTGLPKPAITIESALKKEVFTPGDPMTITCSVPPNTNMLNMKMELTVGERYISKRETSVTLYTTANEDADTAKCKLSVLNKDVSRASYRSWKVKKPLNDEYLRRRYEEIEADKEFMSFRKA